MKPVLATMLPVLALLASCGSRPAPVALSGAMKASPCLGIDIPVETEISIAGAYEGATPPDERARNSGERIVRMVKLASAKLTLPQVLILSSYEPVAWDVSGVQTGLIRGILVTSNEPGSSVTGQTASVPVRQVSRAERNTDTIGDEACGGIHSVHKGGPDLDALVDDAEAATGVVARRFVGAYDPARLDLDGPAEQGKPEQNGSVNRGDARPGIERLTPLVLRGDVRLATEEDIAAWNAAATARLKSGSLAPYREEYLELGTTYVVLKPFEIPEGMHGANSRNFIVPAGVEPPTDADSHNDYYLMDGGRCIGGNPSCERREDR
jgi:hypothetical protein